MLSQPTTSFCFLCFGFFLCCTTLAWSSPPQHFSSVKRATQTRVLHRKIYGAIDDNTHEL
jgi:hypothetical protein